MSKLNEIVAKITGYSVVKKDKLVELDYSVQNERAKVRKLKKNLKVLKTLKHDCFIKRENIQSLESELNSYRENNACNCARHPSKSLFDDVIISESNDILNKYFKSLKSIGRVLEDKIIAQVSKGYSLLVMKDYISSNLNIYDSCYVSRNGFTSNSKKGFRVITEKVLQEICRIKNNKKRDNLLRFIVFNIHVIIPSNAAIFKFPAIFNGSSHLSSDKRPIVADNEIYALVRFLLKRKARCICNSFPKVAFTNGDLTVQVFTYDGALKKALRRIFGSNAHEYLDLDAS